MERDPSPDISFHYEVHYYKDPLWILNNQQMKKQILEAEYNLKIAGYMGQNKTIKLVRQNFI